MLKRVLGRISIIARYVYGRYAYPIPKIYDRITTSELIANNERLSIVRYGDGELGQILSAKDIGFQSYDPKLSTKLLEVLCADDDPDVLICLPNLFAGMHNMKPEPKQYWEKWITNNRRDLSKILGSKRYGDSLVSRLYLPWKDITSEMTIVNNIKKAWLGKDVVIVEGAKTRWGVGNDLLENALTVKRILCPVKNAFTKYDNILSTCLQLCSKNEIFVLALGPTATILAFELAKRGYRALDLGHFDLQYEHMIRRADGRMSIDGKYNNEIENTLLADIDDERYRQSVIADLSEE